MMPPFEAGAQTSMVGGACNHGERSHFPSITAASEWKSTLPKQTAGQKLSGMTPAQKKTLSAIRQARLPGRSRTSAEAYAQMERAMAALNAVGSFVRPIDRRSLKP